jgi:hypothetical protein
MRIFNIQSVSFSVLEGHGILGERKFDDFGDKVLEFFEVFILVLEFDFFD